MDRSYGVLQVNETFSIIYREIETLMFFFYQTQYNKAQHDINETFTFYRQLIDERKGDLIKVRILHRV